MRPPKSAITYDAEYRYRLSCFNNTDSLALDFMYDSTKEMAARAQADIDNKQSALIALRVLSLVVSMVCLVFTISSMNRNHF
jgi:uncharacterized membrane protein